MRTVLKVLLATLMFAFPAWGTTVTLTGTVKSPVGGTLLSGSACFGLPVNAQDTSTSTALTSMPMCYPVTNGTFPAFATLIPNDVIQPLNTYYRTTFYDTSGNPVMYANYVVPTGAGTFNVGAAVPTAVTTSNISYVSPACLSCNNVFTGLNTFTQQTAFTVGIGTPPFAITSTTLVPNLNIQIINGVTVTGTPSAGQAIIATSASAANWQAVTVTSTYTNAGVTGTTLNALAKLTGAPSTAVITATADTGGAIGICTANCSTSGSATISTVGQANCLFDGATVANDYVQISSTVGGDCHDAGASYPASGQIMGRVLSTNGISGTYPVALFGVETKGSTPTVTVPSFTNKNLAGDVPVTANTDTLVDSITVTFPASGGPFRVLLVYDYFFSGGVNGECWITDGSNVWGLMEWQPLNNIGSCQNTQWSKVTYANGTGPVTFSVRIWDSGATTAKATSTFHTATPSYMQVSIFSSN